MKSYKTSPVRKKRFWQFITLLSLVILFFNPITWVIKAFGIKHDIEITTLVKTVDAKEIYPMFTCPCCGEPLNKEDPCCGSMIQMIDFIDQKVRTGANKDDVILATVREFGLERLTNESDRKALRKELLASAPKNAPKLVTFDTSKDLGTINKVNGTVSTEFKIKNAGKSDLVIDELSSSCGCTSASLVYKTKEGPRFYMPGHGFDTADPNWKVAIHPGDEAQIKVYYDPTVHPDLTGPVTRFVTVHSNDPVDFESKFTITLDQEK